MGFSSLAVMGNSMLLHREAGRLDAVPGGSSTLPADALQQAQQVPLRQLSAAARDSLPV